MVKVYVVQLKIKNVTLNTISIILLQVDWSSQNVLSVGLGACVYLWSACTSQVTRLCDLTADSDTVTSVAWAERVSWETFYKDFFIVSALLRNCFLCWDR